jgi:hypothetical protein
MFLWEGLLVAKVAVLVVTIWAQAEVARVDMDQRLTLGPDMAAQADRHPHLFQAVQEDLDKTVEAVAAVVVAMLEVWAGAAQAQAYMVYQLVPRRRQVEPIEEQAARAATVA